LSTAPLTGRTRKAKPLYPEAINSAGSCIYVTRTL
jgi:hypothetical protein